MKKPIIGITLDDQVPGNYSNFPWYAIRNNYLHSVEKLGGIPFPLIHSNKNINSLFEILDGLIITGGNFDINPKIYGEKIQGTRNLKETRTQFEISISKKFLKSNKPILGICGGHQLLNVVCKGTLFQDIKTKFKNTIEHEQIKSRDQTSHKVRLKNNTLLYKIVNEKIIDVNSAHHQSIDKIGKNLIITGLSSDNIIESVEHIKHRWCMGVQWHPEFLITKADKKIIKSFIKASLKK